MRQAIHIFRKDARYRWPYIAAVLALIGLSAWLACRSNSPTSSGLESLIPSLIAFACWFATAAAVHGESLVGDRQFWVTRPYSWKSLLAAKLLFLAAFVGLPFLLSDCITLLACDFNPLALASGLMVRQCWLAALLALPFAVATMTRTIRDFALAGLAFSVVLYLEMFLIALRSGMRALAPEWIWDVVPWLLPVAGLSLAVWQYARRRTGLVRVVALALAPIMPVITVPPMVQPAARAVPYDPKYRNINVEFDPSRGHAFSGGIKGLMYIPVTIDGWPKDLVGCQPRGGNHSSGYGPGGLYCVPSGADGGAWLVLYPAYWLPAEGELSLPMELDVYEALPSVILQPDGGWVRIPGFGGVKLWEEANGEVIMARTALKPAGPEWTYRLGGQTEDGSWKSLFTDNAPNFPTPLAFRTGSVCLKQSQVYLMGTLPHPVRFTARRLAGVIQRELRIANIRLANYQCKEP